MSTVKEKTLAPTSFEARLISIEHRGRGSWCIAKVRITQAGHKSNGKNFTVLGNIKPITIGGIYKFIGVPEYNQAFENWQLKLTSPAEVISDSSIDGLVKYFENEVHGVGGRPAEKLAESFGDKAISMILSDPLEASKVSGVPLVKVNLAADRIRSDPLYTVKIELYSVGLTQKKVELFVKHFGDQAARNVRFNTFELTQLPGIGFLTACKIADKLGIPKDDADRIRAGIQYGMNELMESGGHTCIDSVELMKHSAKLLGVSHESVGTEMRRMTADGLLWTDENRAGA